MTDLVHPVTGKPLKMGRTRPPPVAERRCFLPLRKYIRRAMPPVPDHTERRLKALPGLHQILCNDTLSCCTASGAFHILANWFGNAGHPAVFSNTQIQAFYSRSSGYVVGKPETDQGGDEVTVLDTWRDHGLIVDSLTPGGRRKILGHLSVDGSNRAELKLAIFLFLNLYFGVEMPSDWVGRLQPERDGAVWPVAGDPNPQNGHCFAGIDYVADGVLVDSWGILILVTWDAIAKYCAGAAGGELHVAISEDMLDRATHKAPNGLALDELRADFAALPTTSAAA